ncbi:MAG TPA: hypothetical protein VIE65_05165 [Methylobacter sp.]
MRNVIFILVALLASPASTAKADDQTKEYGGNARSIIEIYDHILVQEDRKHIERLIRGMQIGLLWANTLLKNRKQPLLYCQPDRLTLTDTQVIDMMRQAIIDKPKWGDFPLGMMVLFTLQRNFPC